MNEQENFFTYRFETAEFDEARFELRVAGLPVEVEPRALEVLGYLLRHVGKVVSKEELLENVWAGRITVEKVLPNAINKLRRALGASNAQRLTTQQRMGYRLDGPVTRMAVGPRPSSPSTLEAGQAVPGRDNFILQRRLGARQGSEVWLAVHAKTRDRRVYKFADGGNRLRDLKREVTVSRLLQECALDPNCFVDIIDWNFETAPYFLECEYGGISLLEWSQEHLTSKSQHERLRLFTQIAEAVASAHAIGVLHKDLKPANILIDSGTSGLRTRLTDFGSASLLDPDRLETLGITQLGFSLTEGSNTLSGTPLYIAPELFSGQPATAQSDVFSLGVLLYQLLSDRVGQPMVSGWEVDISDELIREDLHLATNTDPSRRFASAAEFASRLRDLEDRRANARRLHQAEEQARIAREALARSNARQPYVIALVALLALGLTGAVALYHGAVALYHSAVRARNIAQSELERANALSAFINEDLISRANPRVLAKGQDASLRDVLMAARTRLGSRFADQPITEATVRASLGGLFESIDLWPDAEAETRRAMDIYVARGGLLDADALRMRSRLARLLSLVSRHEEAAKEVATLERLYSEQSNTEFRYLVSSARTTYHLTRGEFAKAVPVLEEAIASLREFDPEDTNTRDSMRTQLIFSYTMTSALEKAQQEGAGLISEAEERPGDNAITIAMAKVALARSYSMQKHSEKAFALLDEAEAVIVDHLGAGHSQHLRLVNEQLGVAFREPDWPKALIYSERVYEMMRAKVGADHGQSLIALANWGRTLYETGRLEQARAKLFEAHRKLVEAQGEKAPQSQDAAFALAAAEAELGNLTAAQALVDTIDPAILVASQGNADWAHAMDGLRGLLLLKRGDKDKGLQLLRAGVEGLAASESLQPDRFYRVCRKSLDGALAIQR